MTHILIAEDKYESRYLLKILLEGNGYRVTETSNGEEALTAARNEPPDIIVSDVLMPKMDGFELCRQWMLDDALVGVPFVFYSATYTTAEDLKLALSLGAQRYIIKPQEPEVLLIEIQQVLKEWQAMSAHLRPTLPSDKDFNSQHDASMAHKLQDKLRELEEAYIKLRTGEEKYRGIFDSLQDVYIETTLDGIILDAGPKITTFSEVGYSQEELIGTNIKALYCHLDQRNKLLEALQTDGRVTDFEADIKTKSGGSISCSVSALLLSDKDGKPYKIASMIRDISERKANEAKLSYLAQYDTLTDLPNRLLFKDRLDQAIIEADRHERLVVVLLLDLDRFKHINDTLGHQAGDHILRGVGQRLTAALRPGDTISRLSGDEFGVVLTDVNHVDDVTLLLSKITGVFETPIIFDNRELFLTASIGITIYPIDKNDSETLLRNADTAMYRSKENGYNNYQFYDAHMTAIAQDKLMLEEALQYAVEREELVLHYQPQVNINSGEISGMEALVRWNHPELGLVPPTTFIPLAEETGLILPLGEWVLRTAIRQMKHWQTQGYTFLRMAVNLSSRQFRESNVLQTVQTILEEFSLEARFLELELTESMLLKDVDHTIKTLVSLRELGLQFSIDDFGTGYSSLSYLRKFPVSILKIDRSFVSDINDDPGAASIVKTIIQMAHTLGMEVVAEGVETHEQLIYLREHNCDAIQGYYFSKPVPAVEFTKLLQAKKSLVITE